ncbi:MAG TPA: FmdB family zinc ribbon protein [Candidatus Saccharimonadia bacterium]|nr:FmdB family zinc ribbon protein [Candidatus Saccharimonadia bacterium]
MPIYEYRCLDCGHQFELMQKFSDPPAETCTSCSGTVQKLISRSAFHLKGSGWYVTDYGRHGSANGKATDKNDSESSTESSDKKSTSESSGSASTTSAGTTSTSTESPKSTTASSAA